MKIGVLSDTHDNAAMTRAALDIFRERGVDRLLHCGDVTSPAIIYLFEGWQANFVSGNMDRYRQQDLADAAREIGLTPPRGQLSLTLDGVPIALMHGHEDEVLQNLIERQEHRYVLHGHTHRRRHDTIGRTTVVNPGALGGTKWQPRSVAIIDLAAQAVEFIQVEK